MKAAQINQYGHADEFNIVEIDKPQVQADQVLVEVYASSINPIEYKVREGFMKDIIPVSFPAVLGGDIAGTVVESGDNVQDFQAGDKVYGQASILGGGTGAFAEYAATKTNQIALMPTSIDFEHAASLPLAAVSALQAVTEHINLQPGQKLFIHGGSGGIGSIALQIAKHLGAHLTASIKGTGADFVKQLGADEIIDTEDRSITEGLSDFDAVFDTVGGDDFVTLFQILKPGGIAVTMAAYGHEEAGKQAGITSLTQSTQVTTERLNALRELVDQKVVTPQIDQTYTLDQIQEAFEAKENGSVKGKIVIKIKQDN